MANRISTTFDFRESGGLKKVKADIQSAETATGKLKAGVKGLWGEFQNNRAAQAAVAGLVTKMGIDAVNAASDLEESVAAVRGTFGASADDILALGENSAESFGMSKRALYDFSVQFSAFAKQIAERDGRAVVEVTEEMTQRVADFASRHNLSMEESGRVIQSTLAGETEAFRRYGGDVSAATIKVFAWRNGIAETGEELTESQKVLARYGAFMEQTDNVAGDFKATQDGLANSSRTLTATIEDLQAAVGEGLAPEVAKAVQLMTDMADAAKALPGPIGETVDTVRTFVDPLHAARKAWGALKGGTDEAVESNKAYSEALDAWKREAQAAIDKQFAYGNLLRESAREATYNADAQDEMGRIQSAVTRITDRATEAQRRFMQSIQHSRDEVGALKREIDDQQAWLNLQDAFESTTSTLEDQNTTTREAMQAVLGLKEQVLDYAEAINLPDSVTTRLIADIDAGKRADVEAFLARIGNGVTLPIKPQIIQTSSSSRIRVDEFGNVRAYDTGGVVPGPKGSPQFAVVHGGETILPTHKGPVQLPTSQTGGNTASHNVTINVSVAPGADGTQAGRQIAQALESYYRNGGRRV